HKTLGEVLAKGEDGVKDVVEVPRNGGERERGAEEGGEEAIFGRGVVNESEVEVAEGDFKVMSRLVFFGKIGRYGELVGGFEDVCPPPEAEGVVWRAGCLGTREDCASSRRVLVAKQVVFVDDMEPELVQRFLIAAELVQVVPAHGVQVGL